MLLVVLVKKNVLKISLNFDFTSMLCEATNGHQGAQIHWFQKEVWLYVSLWENEPTSHLIYDRCEQFFKLVYGLNL